ncbi:MAG: dihydrofolate reductase [Myxococcota bacterium]
MSEPLGIVVAMARRRVIGRDNELPWHVPEDLRHFRRVTAGHAILMGRRTHESIGRPLPQRRNIVVSRRPGLRIAGCEVVGSLHEGVQLARDGGDPMPMVIGGAQLYADALPHATHLFITEIDRDVEGNVTFPPFDRSRFREVARHRGDTPDVTFVTLKRVGSGA